MIIVPYQKQKHYETMCRLWDSYGWIPCPQEAIPRAALVAETSAGEFIAFLSMYIADKMALIDWALKDRRHDRKIGDEAIKTMFNMLVETARKSECAFIYSITKTKSWGEKLLSYGMMTAETGVTTYILSLTGMDTSFISD
jgi:hypothetical protein